MSLTIPTIEELYNLAKAEIQSRQSSLTDFTEGSVLDALTGATSLLTDQNIRLGIEQFRKVFVATAEGTDLDALAEDLFTLYRNSASNAVGQVTFTRGVSVGDLLIPAGTEVSGTLLGTTYVFSTDDNVTLLAADTEVDADVTATSTGPEYNLAAGLITSVDTPVVGDASLTVTNAERMAGGAVEEVDAAFRRRIRSVYAALEKSTIGALKNAALEVDGVSFATVDESTIYNNAGYVSVYVGDPDGAGNSTLAGDVEIALESVRACGIEVRVFAAAREEISLEVDVTIQTGVSAASILSDIITAILEYTDNLEPNEPLRLSRVIHAVHQVSSDIKNVSVVSPQTDLEPTEKYNALRVLEPSLTVNIEEEDL